MKFSIRVLFLFSHILSSLLYAQSGESFEWVMPGDNGFSSSFGEYRSGHFHAGIDFRTPKGVGMDIIAPYEGEVVRAKTGPWGYGHVIYFKGDNGLISVFAHLSRFADDLEEHIVEWQYKEESYAVERWFSANQFRYKAGDVIAKSGDTGAGSPHLHYEIRRDMDNVLNPQSFGYVMKDSFPPKILSLLVMPKDNDAFIFDPKKGLVSSEYVIISPVEKSAGSYELKDTVFVSGKIAMGIKSFDYQSHENGNRMGPYVYSLYEGERPIFYARYDSFTYAETRLVAHAFDLFVEEWGENRFHRLFKKDYLSAAPFETTAKGAGILELSPGSTGYYTIKTSDFNGNESSLSFYVKWLNKNEQPDIPLRIFDWGGAIIVDPSIDHSAFHMSVSEDKGVSYGNLVTRVEDNYISFKGKVGDIIKVRYKAENSLSLSLFYSLPAQSDFIDSNKDTLSKRLFADENFVFIEITSNNAIGYPKSTEILPPADYTLTMNSHREMVYRIPFDGLEEDHYNLRVEFYNGYVGELDFFVAEVSPKGRKLKRNAIGNLDYIIEFAESTLYEERKFAIVNDEKSLSIHPANLLLKKNANIWLADHSHREDLRDKLCVAKEWNDKLYFSGNEKDSRYGDEFTKASVNSFGRFYVEPDTIPPILKFETLRANKITYRLEQDDLSGFSDKFLPQTYIDDEWVLTTYDPEANMCYVMLKKALSKGKHNIRINCSDRAGNISEKTTVLSVE